MGRVCQIDKKPPANDVNESSLKMKTVDEIRRLLTPTLQNI